MHLLSAGLFIQKSPTMATIRMVSDPQYISHFGYTDFLSARKCTLISPSPCSKIAVVRPCILNRKKDNKIKSTLQYQQSIRIVKNVLFY
jgi:hypothetical protein